MAPLDWWPKVLAAQAQEVAVALGGGLGGPKEWEEDLALAGSPMLAGRLGASLTPHPYLILGACALGLGLGGGRASLPRSLPLYPGQVVPKVPLLS